MYLAFLYLSSCPLTHKDKPTKVRRSGPWHEPAQPRVSSRVKQGVCIADKPILTVAWDYQTYN